LESNRKGGLSQWCVTGAGKGGGENGAEISAALQEKEWGKKGNGGKVELSYQGPCLKNKKKQGACGQKSYGERERKTKKNPNKKKIKTPPPHKEPGLHLRPCSSFY